MQLIKEHLTLGSDDNQTIYNSNIATYDNSVSGDEDIFFDVDASNNLTVDYTSQSTQEVLYVLANNTYQPASASGVTTYTHDFKNSGTTTLNGNNLKLTGSWTNSATLSSSTSTVTFTAQSGTETINNTSGTGSFYNVTLGETSGTTTWNLSSAVDIDGALNITYGTLSMNGANNLNVAGNFTIGSSGIYTKGTGNFTFDGSATQTITDNESTKSDLGYIRFNTTSHTVQIGTSAIITNIIIPANITFSLQSSGYTLTLSGNGTGTSRPFYINGGTFSSGTDSTVIYRTSANTEIQSTTYDNLKFENSSGVANPTFTLGTATSQTITTDSITFGDGTNSLTIESETYDPTTNVSGNLLINANATFSASSTGTTNIAGNWTNSGTFTRNNSTITFNSTTTGKTLSGTLTGSGQFYKVLFNGLGGGWTINDPMLVSANVSKTFEIAQGTVTVGNGNADDLTIIGNTSIGSASGAATLQTISSLAQGSTVTINVNSTTPVSCSTCTVDVGTTTDANPTGTLIINKNGILKFNSYSTVNSGLVVNDSGRFVSNGSLDDSGTAGSSTNDSNIEDPTKSWTNNIHQNKSLVVTSGFATGQIHTITGNDNNTIYITDSNSVTDTSGSYTTATNTYTSGVSMISTSNDAEDLYLFNQTQSLYSRIISSTENATSDSFVIADYPNDFTYTTGDYVTISYGILEGDAYEIADFANIAGGRGTTCDTDGVNYFNGYINSNTNSQTEISYTEICDIGDNVSGKYGIAGNNIVEADTNEGFSIIDSYLHDNYIGTYLSSSSGITVNLNTYKSNNIGLSISSSNNNILSSNTILKSSTSGISLTSANRNFIHHNTVANSTNNISLSNSTLNRIYDNIVFDSTKNILLSSSNDNFIYQNNLFSSSSYCLELNSSSNITSYSNQYYSSGSGVYLSSSTNNNFIADDFGKAHDNSTDIELSSSSTSSANLYGVDLLSTTEVSGVSATGSYIISKNHDPESKSGQIYIWGEYTVPNDVSETVSNNEGLLRANYVDAIWNSFSTISSYSGTGTRDTDLQITLNSAISQIEVYEAVVTTANADTPTFTIIRTGGTATPATYTLPSTYTESTTRVSFTIQDGATNYALGDKYIFVVIPSSNSINTSKTINVMQAEDILNAGLGESLELIGSAGYQSQIIGATGGFALSIDGTINADYYKITKTDGNGLNITSNATVTALSNGVFDENQGSGSTDTYIRVAPEVLNDGAVTFLSLTFDEATSSDSNVNYNVTLTGTPSACTNAWTFQNTIGNLNTESYDSDTGDGGGCSAGQGYILFTIVSDTPPNSPTSLSQKTTSDVSIPQFGWTSQTSVKFTAIASDPDLTDTLALCVEVDPIGTAFSNTEDACGTAVSYSGTPINVEYTRTGLTNGVQYHWQARLLDGNSNYSSWVSFGTNTETQRDFGIDTSAPTSGTVYDGNTLSVDIDENDGNLNLVEANFTGFTDTDSGIKDYQYAIGTTSGGTDIVNWTNSGYLGNLFHDGFESGDFSTWDSSSVDSGDLSVTIDRAVKGLYSVNAVINDATNIYVQDTFANQTEIYARFYFYMQARTLGNGNSLRLFSINSGSTQRAYVEYARSGSTYFLRGVETVGSTTTSQINLNTGQWYYIELHWKAGTSESVRLTVDNTNYYTSTANTSSLTVNNTTLGAFNISTGITANLYYDSYDSDTATDINPNNFIKETITASGHLHTGQTYYVSIRAVNNASSSGTSTSSDGFTVLPTFSFGLDKSSIQFIDLSPSNSWSDSQTISTIASTNAYNGYITRLYISQPFTNKINNSYTIPNFSGTNTTPLTWSGTGFGYTTNDNNLLGGTADRFTFGGQKYSGFLTNAPGDPVADHTTFVTGTTGPLSSQLFNITLKVGADASQAAGPYTTDLIFISTPNF